MSQEQEAFEEGEKNTYVVDAHSAAEMARLLRQDQLITAGMGGIFPEQPDLSEVQRVLDLACGPGGWPLEVAYAYSDIEVVGVDISERMITYAQSQAQVQQRANVRFRVMDILKPLDFPMNSFDLVNARLISAFMLRESWPTFFRECSRVLRPGGVMRLTESELGSSNKPHFEKTWHLIFEAVRRAGLNFSATGYNQGIIQMLPALFRQSGLTVLGRMAHAIDISFGSEAHEGFYRDFSMAFQLLEPFLVKMQITTANEWRDLSHQCLLEMLEEDFCSVMLLLTVWGSRKL
ncbi:MAG TPA: methyltransferase domain-containing protein [Ktedonobacteraceae bacterium]